MTQATGVVPVPFSSEPVYPSSAHVYDPQTRQAYQVSIEVITPELAQQYLGRQVANRRPKQGMIEDKLVPDILAGRFELNGETIVFDADGVLRDGQHRLLAVIRAGQPVKTFVIRGIGPAVVRTIDTGIARTVSDHLGVRGESNRVSLGAITRAVVIYQQTGGFSSRSMQVSVSQVDDFINDAAQLALLRDAASFVATTCRSTRDGVPILNASGVYGLLYILFRAKDDALAREFFSRVFSDAGHSPGDPELALRRKLVNARRDKERLQDTDIAYICIYAWNYRQERRQWRIAKVPRANEQLRIPVIAEANPMAYAPGPLQG